MIPLYNFHSHSQHCDGKEQMEDYVKAAIKKNFKALGFSAHSPLPFPNEWSLTPESFRQYVKDAQYLIKKYSNEIDLYLGLEIDYIPGHSEDFKGFMEKTPLDYNIGSVHLVRNEGDGKIWFIDGPMEGYINGVNEIFNGDYRAAVTAFYRQTIRMIETQQPQIIGHIDKVKMHNKQRWFSTSEKWYTDLVDETLDAAKKHGCIIEVNTRGIYTGKTDEYFPSVEIIKKCHDLDIPMMVNSDAHHPDQLDNLFVEAHDMLRKIGFKRLKTPFFEYEI
ncbi:MAG: histidinol-phosphatase [Bacteroidota bacterium]